MSPTCTLVDAAVQVDKQNIITVLRSLFTEHSLNGYESNERGLLLAIMHFSPPNTDNAQSTFHARQHPFALDGHFKLQLLDIAVPALHRLVHPLAKPLPKFDADVFKEIGAYIASDLWPSWENENSRSALECLVSLMHREPHFHVPEQWPRKSFFLNIAKLCPFLERHKYSLPQESSAKFCPCHQDDSALRSRRLGDSSNVYCSIIYILSQGFSRGMEEAYEAFRDKCSWGYIATLVEKHPKAIDGVTGYITGLSEATKKEENENPDATFPRSYIDDLHQAEAIRSICATIVRSRTPLRPILESLASVDPNHQEWSNILTKLNSDGDVPIEGYNFPEKVSRDDKERFKTEMKHAREILETCLEAKGHRKGFINWVSTLFISIHLP